MGGKGEERVEDLRDQIMCQGKNEQITNFVLEEQDTEVTANKTR